MNTSLHGRSILIADDDTAIRTLLQDILELGGASVYLAQDGPQALDIIRDHPLDLAILDIQMPEPDGLTILRSLRAANNPLPILIITAHQMSQSDVQAIQCSDTAYIPKPFDPERILHTVQRTMSPLTP
jgi:CheY-like chemotaxis protein